MLYSKWQKRQKIISSFSSNTPFIEKHLRNVGAFFVGRNEVVIVEKSKTIYCPKCGRRVATWDGKTSINPIGHCRKCNKRVVFVVETQETIIKDLPIRATSSGKTFY